MPTLEITDDQADRLAELAQKLASEQALRYATVQQSDVVAYLLDLEREIEDPLREVPSELAIDETTGDPSTATSGNSPERNNHGESDEGESKPAETDADPSELREQMLNLLDVHDEKWHEGQGEEPYEVELPSGETKPARTKDDVKSILFEYY